MMKLAKTFLLLTPLPWCVHGNDDCPSFSLDIQGDTCDGDIHKFNDAIEPVYQALMRLEEVQVEWGELGSLSMESLVSTTQETGHRRS